MGSLLSGLSRYQWGIVRATREIASESREEYVATLTAYALTADALQEWEACIHLCRPAFGVHTSAKRSKLEAVPCQLAIPCPLDLLQREWFASCLCPFLSTRDASNLRATESSLPTFVASYQWDDLTVPIPFQHMHLWRKCFPLACGAHVVLFDLPHPSIPSSEGPFIAPHDSIFERFKGLRRLTLKGAAGYVISDAAFAHLAGIVELTMPGWKDIALLTDAGLEQLSGIRKLDFSDTYSLHLTSNGFRHLSGVACSVCYLHHKHRHCGMADDR